MGGPRNHPYFDWDVPLYTIQLWGSHHDYGNHQFSFNPRPAVAAAPIGLRVFLRLSRDLAKSRRRLWELDAYPR